MIHQRPDNVDLYIATLAELGASSSQPLGIRVFVDEDRAIYINVGHAFDALVRDRGWSGRHIWMPVHVVEYVRTKHPAVSDPVRAASRLVQRPDYVYADERDADTWIVIVDAAVLRDLDIFTSTTTRYVDAIIERRHVENGFVLRLFHLSPRKKLPNGAQIWP